MRSNIAIRLQFTAKQQVSQAVGIVIGIIQTARYIGIVNINPLHQVIIGITMKTVFPQNGKK